jgi:hypothetical protein
LMEVARKKEARQGGGRRGQDEEFKEGGQEVEVEQEEGRVSRLARSRKRGRLETKGKWRF